MRTNKLKRYDAYMASGVEWLGEIPEHWETISNRHVFKIKKNLVGKLSYKYDLLSLTLSGVIKRDMENPTGKFPAEFDTYQEVSKGDFVFCLFDVEETPRTIGLSQHNGMITGAYTVMQAASIFNAPFLFYFYYNHDQSKSLRHLYTGLRNTISKEKFLAYKTFIPPFSEQTAIAQFLDTKTALIDKAIELKEKQIALLKERRQAIIHQAVTKGLNPDVPMKDSGIDWVGQIPAHWEVKKLKYVFDFIGGGTPSKERLDYWNGDIPWVSPKDMKSDKIKVTEEFLTCKGLKNCPSSLLTSNSLIMVVRSGILKRVVPVAITKVEVAINQDMKAFIPLGEVLPNFMFFFIKGNEIFLKNDWVKQGATVESIEMELLRNFSIAYPPYTEQNQIIDHVRVLSTEIEKILLLIEQEIEKLKEYKASLINSAVTGKIKVT
ncbi:restriction endonuclease subunit S [Chitinophaga sp. LS1]|uniref:restriction endonuclease subunit S n=1 Tax=Chitinophaga sp. LS1 TaxID=3051176 RepID=UPI002AAC4AE4|nr:restriction endonuclease subunit S [Chitinophaga sp. LS1]WPV69204.1 restriction endonuclease subunit S [Chitinophaga sp. LS1]